MRRILLVEPGYKTRYPPLGLMKISSYHKLQGDYVCFVKGCNPIARLGKWDRIYISSLFTFYWKVTIDTIRYYSSSVESPEQIVVGGAMATLLADEVRSETGVRVIPGLLDKPGIVDPESRICIDIMIPDYSLLDEGKFKYSLSDAYLAYASRGCPNRCGFCAVNRIEPEFIHYLPLKRQVQGIEAIYGPKQHLILLDNNVLASNQFERIIEDIVELGFGKRAKLNGRLRHVDFNQGIDIRLITAEKLALLSKTAINPLRLAFDHIELKDLYVKCVRMAVEQGITSLSNYVLFNYNDTPQDFYERLRINLLLNQELGILIYSFPMKYVPLDAKDRSFIGKHWNRQLLRGVQCILLATRGLVGTDLDFFEAAFGASPEEFIEIAMMPEDYIIHRNKHRLDGAAEWRESYRKLNASERQELAVIVSDRTGALARSMVGMSSAMRSVVAHYGDQFIR